MSGCSNRYDTLNLHLVAVTHVTEGLHLVDALREKGANHLRNCQYFSIHFVFR